MDKRKSSFIRGTIFGAVIGSVAALLLAPKSGKETQADLKRRAKSMKEDIVAMLHDLRDELDIRLGELKSAAKDLKGEAREESQDLIKRAEVLKSDLQSSASSLAKLGGTAKDQSVQDAKRLLNEGAAVMSELERVTKKMLSSARDKVRRDSNGESSGGEN